jgi:YHS domain-containing protein
MVLATIALAACVGDRPRPVDDRPHARCLPCVKEGDLPCIDVRVDASTPRVEWQGKTYYFCSEVCRSEFTKDPTAYVSLDRH